ncbi:hypothetical protein NEUTE2DRAFT_119265 [Neurospora tetrasperma FGSC 2509]|nr:hypothetical protein NEUTE2DRAFT_119265 [Neurospora tetrasperma FGSC 2509]
MGAGCPVPGVLGLSPANGHGDKAEGMGFCLQNVGEFCSGSEEEEPCIAEPLKEHRSGYCFE